MKYAVIRLAEINLLTPRPHNLDKRLFCVGAGGPLLLRVPDRHRKHSQRDVQSTHRHIYQVKENSLYLFDFKI